VCSSDLDGRATLFYSRYSALSNHNPAPFTVEKRKYKTSEQFYFAEKCRLYGDDAQRERVLAAKDPKDCQRLGRKARNYNDIDWRCFEEDAMSEACYEKFTQNPIARRALLRTGDTTLGESSRSKKWGTGFPLSHPRAFYQNEWEENLLGKILTEVRSTLQRQLDR
jgi:hypothetical protein